MFKSFLGALLLVSASTGAVRAFAPCGKGQSEMSVEGVEGIFCVDGMRVCIADISDGACPPKQTGLEFGSYCGLVATKVYGCKTLTAQSILTLQLSATPAPTTVAPTPATPAPVTVAPGSNFIGGTLSISSNCPDGSAEMSVEGAQGIFCVKGGPLCSADVKNGLCPGVETPRLPLGSYCGVVASGVYGCKASTTTATTPAPTIVTPGTPASTPAPITATPGTPAPTTVTPSTPATTTTTTSGSTTTTTTGGQSTTTSANCPNGGAEMSVEGAQGIFCVKGGPLCSADVKNGLCPGVETPRLPLGSYCGVVASGVYGCKASTSTTTTPASTTAAPGTLEPTTVTPGTPAPTIATPNTPAPTSVTPGTSAPTPAPTTAAPSTSTGGASTSSQTAPGSNCPIGESEVSVEGVKGFFCILGDPICSGNISTGLCPGKNDRLPIGSYCGVVASGVYGCKILNAQSVATLTPTLTPAPTPSSVAPVTPTPVTPALSTPAPTPSNTTTTPSTSTSADCPNGGTPMSVEGCHKIFCVQGVACAGEISNGTCPTANAAMGLPKGSYCTIVRPGVYGCKPIA